jgi:23S rRNA (cytidine1920-2'-O)/16S rRNA (cytidine1409-2'-O)-methyltransferase
MSKQRLDTLLVDRGLAESREKAQALVMAGQVTIGDRPAIKPGVLVASDASLNVVHGPKYVGRGGEKLEHALNAFDRTSPDSSPLISGLDRPSRLSPAKRVCVYAVDVGRGQLDYRRRDNRVVSMEDQRPRS